MPAESNGHRVTLLNMGPRHARTCPVEKCSPRWRSFGEPKAVCPEHHRGVDQPDAIYHPPSEDEL